MCESLKSELGKNMVNLAFRRYMTSYMYFSLSVICCSNNILKNAKIVMLWTAIKLCIISKAYNKLKLRNNFKKYAFFLCQFELVIRMFDIISIIIKLFVENTVEQFFCFSGLYILLVVLICYLLKCQCTNKYWNWTWSYVGYIAKSRPHVNDETLDDLW